MESSQPFVEGIHVEAAWSGDISDAVNLRVLLDIVVKDACHLSLIRKSHPSVLLAEDISILNLSRTENDVSQFNYRSCHRPHRHDIFNSPRPLSNTSMLSDQQYITLLLRDERMTGTVFDEKAHQNADNRRGKNPFITSDQGKFPAETAGSPLFAQTASLYEATSSRDSALSPPPPPPTSKKLTIAKRLIVDPRSFHTSDHESSIKQRMSRADDSSPQSRRKRPVSVDKRPPWRPVGAQESTQRGRTPLCTDVAKRRISRSAATVHVHRGRTRHRQSSLPGRITKPARVLQNLQEAERQDGTQTLPRGRLTRSPMHTGLRDRDTTVKVTRYVEALNASERLEKWLEDGRTDWPAQTSCSTKFISDSDRSFHLSKPQESSEPALSPSPTPSSRKALPWTSVRGIRGGGSVDGIHSEFSREFLVSSLVEDNGTIFAFFHSCSAVELKTTRLRIQVHASIKLEAQNSGCHSLSIPGLPLQSGNAEGTFNLRVVKAPSTGSDNFKAHEKIAFVGDDFSTRPLNHYQMSHRFRLDTPFNLRLLCFETCRVLVPSDFEIDGDVHTRYDWENLDGDGISAEHSMVCSLRLHPFLMWAETVAFNLYLIGGPSGTIETSLEPGNRRIYLDGKRCDAEHELEISLICPVADLQKTFTISWEQSLGIPPLEVWLPRISGLHRQKLDELFDLPNEVGTSITLRPCKGSRAYSMAAQEKCLKASGEIHFFPENQHTPRTIQQSLAEHSGQFYDELTADDLVPASATPSSKNRATPLKHAIVTLKPNKRSRPKQSDIFGSVLTDRSHSSGSCVVHDKNVKAMVPTEFLPATARVVSPEVVPNNRTSFLHRSVLSTFSLMGWIFNRLAMAVGIVKSMILIWLCLRAFRHDSIVQLEDFTKFKAIDAWNKWEFEPVQLHGDFTGWKHLMAKIIHDGHIGVLEPTDKQPEKVVEKADETATRTEETSTGKPSGIQQPLPMQEEFKTDSPSDVKVVEAGKEPWTLLDRIDLVLGWKPPARSGGERNGNAD